MPGDLVAVPLRECVRIGRVDEAGDNAPAVVDVEVVVTAVSIDREPDRLRVDAVDVGPNEHAIFVLLEQRRSRPHVDRLRRDPGGIRHDLAHEAAQGVVLVLDRARPAGVCVEALDLDQPVGGVVGVEAEAGVVGALPDGVARRVVRERRVAEPAIAVAVVQRAGLVCDDRTAAVRIRRRRQGPSGNQS